MEWLETLGIASIPGALAVASIKWMLSSWFKKLDEKDKMREERDFLFYKGITSSIGLSSTMAKELKEKEHVNGGTEEYVAYATAIKHDLEDCYAKIAADHMH